MAGKNDTPPPLPHEILHRVYRIARFEGKSMLILSGAFAVLAAMNRDLTGALAGCLAAGAGAVELHGTHRLEEADPEGVSWLIRAQLLLLGTVLLYVSARILQFDPVELQRALTTAAKEQFVTLRLSDEQVLSMLDQGYRTLYTSVAIVTILYQGGMALYYHRRRDAIQIALAE
jgi:hypothetical protein